MACNLVYAHLTRGAAPAERKKFDAWLYSDPARERATLLALQTG